MKSLFLMWIAAGTLAASAMAGATVEQPAGPTATDKVTISGWALSMSNVATGANQTIQIRINSWSTASQRKHLIDTFMAKKQDGLLSELEKQPERGRFNFPGYMGPDPNNTMRLGTDIRYAMSFPGEDGGRRIVIITPRVIGFRETVNQREQLTIRSRCSRCTSIAMARAKARWPTRCRSTSTRRRTTLSSRTIRPSRCA